jgi:2-polyprenyl-3-methyl-5-hydroxy-6-metoxy-1,4-benzoquinol methylase
VRHLLAGFEWTRADQSTLRRLTTESTVTVPEWDEFYKDKPHTELSWYETPPTTLGDIDEFGRDPAKTSVLDVGGGVSTLAGHLVAKGHPRVIVLDLAASAADAGDEDPHIERVTGDVRTFRCGDPVDLWHDRATFHFLTTANDRAAYRKTLEQCLAPSGAAVIATFAPDGPSMCAGRDVRRYSEEALREEFVGVLEPVGCRTHLPLKADPDQRPYTICRFGKSRPSS